MRRFFFILAFFTLSQFLYGQNFGSKEKTNYDLIIRSLTLNNIEYEIRPLLKDFGGFGSSVHARILANPAPGSETSVDPFTFVLAVPMCADFAVQTALEFIAGAKKHSGEFRANLVIAFLADEKSQLDDSQFNNDQYDHKGLRDLISLPDMPNTWVVCYLDADSSPESFVIRHGSGDYIAPLRLVRPLPALFKTHAIPLSFEVRFNELYKLGLTGGSRELALLWQGEINGLNLVPGRESGRAKITAYDFAQLLVDYALSANDLSEPSVQNNLDRHYILFSLPNTIFFVSGRTAVILILVILALLLLGVLVLSTIKRIALISKARLFFRYSWIFIILLPLMVLIIRGTGLFFIFLQNIFNAPNAGKDFGGSILIFLLAGWLFMLLSRLLNILHFSRRAEFFGVSAVILSVIGLLTSAAMDFGLIPVFLWSLVFAYLGDAFKKPILIYICAILIPLRILAVMINIGETGNIPVFLFITEGGLRNWLATFQIALLCLPVILLIKRAVTILRRKVRWIIKYRIKVRGKGLLSIVLSAIHHIVFFVILLTLIIIQVNIFSREPEIPERRVSENPGLLSISIDESVFQESRVINLSLESPADPLMFSLFLKSENNETPQIYLSPVPVERQQDNSLMFVLGENPPNPLNLEIVLQKDFRGSFLPQAIYENTIVIGQPLFTSGIPE